MGGAFTRGLDQAGSESYRERGQGGRRILARLAGREGRWRGDGGIL